MKKILLATTVLVGTAGFAAAEVTLSGDARMGVVSVDGADASFSSRARVAFSLSGETDGGLSFGASFRADNASSGALTEDGVESGADNGTAGTVFISGAFGKISMGDNDSAAHTAVGQVAGVGYTGNHDLNEVTYLDDAAPSVLYTYSAGSLSVMVSTGPVGADENSIAAAYTMGDYTFAAGVESHGDEADDHMILGGSAKFGAVSVKGIYGTLGDASQYALSASYTADALTVTAFTADDSELGGDEAYGVGASYDLGGGAAVAAGYSRSATAAESSYDLGVTFSF